MRKCYECLIMKDRKMYMDNGSIRIRDLFKKIAVLCIHEKS